MMLAFNHRSTTLMGKENNKQQSYPSNSLHLSKFSKEYANLTAQGKITFKDSL